MDRIDYWLLDSVIEHPYSVYWLDAPSDEFEFIFNRDHHGLSQLQVAQKLYQLWQRGDLDFFDTSVEDDEPKHLADLTLSNLADALAGRLKLSYAVTDQGGAQWERVSNPDWRRYLFSRGSPLTDSEAIAADRDIVQHYLELIPFISVDEAIIPTTVRWDEVHPWRATYWKVLPVGYRVRFRMTVKPFEPCPDWAFQRWTKLLRWYTNPFTTPPSALVQ